MKSNEIFRQMSPTLTLPLDVLVRPMDAKGLINTHAHTLNGISPNMRSDVAKSLNRDLSKISTWCNSWGMRLNPNKTQSMIVSRSRTVFPPHPDLLVGNTSLNFCDSFKILGVMFDSMFTFERHIHSISFSVAQKIGLLRKSFRICGDHAVLLKCFNSFILHCLEYCSPVWSSAADSHLKLLDRNL